MKVDELGLLPRHLYMCNSVCFLKQGTPLRQPGRLNILRFSCCFENTHHLKKKKTKRRSLDETEVPSLKVWMRGLIAQSKRFT